MGTLTLGLARTEGLESALVTQNDLAGLHHQGKLGVDAVSIGLGPEERER
jgi:hypothetical protein